jgi:hypothetical protein
MKIIFLLLGIIAGLGGIGCSIYILIEAFRDAVWKGLLFFFCGLYGLYYMLFEFEDDNKLLIVLGAIFGLGIGGGLMAMAR